MTVGQAHAAAPDSEVRTVSSRRERNMLWREVRSSNLFTGLHAFQDFFEIGGGAVFYMSSDPSHWLILGRWKEGCGIGIIWAFRAGANAGTALLERALDSGGALGFSSLITRPLSYPQAVAYMLTGFQPWREITVFEMPVSRPAPEKPGRALPDGVTLRGLRPGDTSRVLALDVRSFDEFWSLDRYTLAGIAHAAEVNAFHLATSGSRLVGYAITGVTGGRGYLQRLGVDPEHQGRGIGRALAEWTLWWMSRNGASLLTVNTQRDNEPAIRLYESLGFRQTGVEKFLFSHEVNVG